MKLKPTEFEVNFVYKCPICNAPRWLSAEEVKTKDFKFVCCKKAYTVQQVKKVKVQLNFAQTVTSTPTSTPKTPKNLGNKKNKSCPSLVDEAYRVLRAYKYPKEDIVAFYHKGKFTSAEKLVRAFLKTK